MEEIFTADFEYFTNYGEPDNSINQEILNDLKSFIVNSVRSLPFDRERGLGIEYLENETFNEALVLKIKLYVLEQIFKKYNLSVPPYKRVVTSYDYIDVDNKDGVMTINIRYFNQKDIGTSEMEFNEAIISV